MKKLILFSLLALALLSCEKDNASTYTMFDVIGQCDNYSVSIKVNGRTLTPDVIHLTNEQGVTKDLYYIAPVPTFVGDVVSFTAKSEDENKLQATLIDYEGTAIKYGYKGYSSTVTTVVK